MTKTRADQRTERMQREILEAQVWPRVALIFPARTIACLGSIAGMRNSTRKRKRDCSLRGIKRSFYGRLSKADLPVSAAAAVEFSRRNEKHLAKRNCAVSRDPSVPAGPLSLVKMRVQGAGVQRPVNGGKNKIHSVNRFYELAHKRQLASFRKSRLASFTFAMRCDFFCEFS